MPDLAYNKRLLAKVRRGGYRTDSKGNLRASFRNNAEAEADKLHEEYRGFLRRELGHSNFLVTTVVCMAEAVRGHVYEYPSDLTPRGVGRGKCIFCGLDDLD